MPYCLQGRIKYVVLVVWHLVEIKRCQRNDGPRPPGGMTKSYVHVVDMLRLKRAIEAAGGSPAVLSPPAPSPLL